MLQSSKPIGVAVQMPLADDGGGIAGSFEQLRERRLLAVEPGLARRCRESR